MRRRVGLSAVLGFNADRVGPAVNPNSDHEAYPRHGAVTAPCSILRLGFDDNRRDETVTVRPFRFNEAR